MKRVFMVIGWEYTRHFLSRRFMLATVLSPLILAAIALIPPLYLYGPEANQSQIGFVDFDSTSHFDAITTQLALTNDSGAQVLLVPILPDTVGRMAEDFRHMDSLTLLVDSLNEEYNKVSERRRYIFQRPSSSSRTRQLDESYQQLQKTREARDLTELAYQKAKAELDSLVIRSVIDKADSLLTRRIIEGYVVVDESTIFDGIVRFHATQPVNFLRIQPLKQALQVMLVESRMSREGVTLDKMEEILQPVEIREILSEGSVKREFKLLVTYLAPIIVVLLLFISIFSSTGFLFNSVVYEKSRRVIEYLLSSVTPVQLIFGKVIGLGLLGLTQILVWMLLAAGLSVLKLIPAADIGFLTLQNAGLFLLYYLLGYLFFASIFVSLGALSSWEQDTRYLSQIMRVLSILPVALAIFVFQSPDSFLVRILSFIPFLTPTFMILRTPIGQPPPMDYYISSAILVISIILCLIIAFRVFTGANLVRDQKLSLSAVRNLIQK